MQGYLLHWGDWKVHPTYSDEKPRSSRQGFGACVGHFQGPLAFDSLVLYTAVSSMLQGYSSVFQALLGTFFTWAMTAAGAALVFVFSSGQVSCFLSGGSQGPCVSSETVPLPHSSWQRLHGQLVRWQCPLTSLFSLRPLTRSGDRHLLVAHKPHIVLPSPASGTPAQKGVARSDSLFRLH